jgi:hypothetical protein
MYTTLIANQQRHVKQSYTLYTSRLYIGAKVCVAALGCYAVSTTEDDPVL